MKKNDSLSDRIKNNYKNRYQFYFTRRTSIILRLDRKAFNTLTSKCEKPFDNNFVLTMQQTAKLLCKEIREAKYAYVQSDEISILVSDFDQIETSAWFDYNLQKMVNIASGLTSSFLVLYGEKLEFLIVVLLIFPRKKFAITLSGDKKIGFKIQS